MATIAVIIQYHFLLIVHFELGVDHILLMDIIIDWTFMGDRIKEIEVHMSLFRFLYVFGQITHLDILQVLVVIYDRRITVHIGALYLLQLVPHKVFQRNQSLRILRKNLELDQHTVLRFEYHSSLVIISYDGVLLTSIHKLNIMLEPCISLRNNEIHIKATY